MSATISLSFGPKPPPTRYPWLAAMAWMLIASTPAVASLVPVEVQTEPASQGQVGASLEPARPVGSVEDRDEAESSTLADLSGSWNYASGSSGRSRIEDAIDVAIEDLQLGKSIAKHKLSKKLDPAPTLDLKIDGSKVSLQLGAMAIRDANMGEWIAWTHEGTQYEVRFTKTKRGDLVQEARSSKSSIRRRFKLASNGKITVHFKLSDERLPGDVKFWLQYK